MIKLLNNSEYIELCEAIGDEILSLSICKRYKELQDEMKRDPRIKTLIAEFEKAKEIYEEVERYGGKYHPDYKEATNRLIGTKIALFQNETISAFKECEKEIQFILDEIAKCLTEAVAFKDGKKMSSCKSNGGNCSC